MNINKQAGSTAIIAIVIAGLFLVGGVAIYALTTGSNGDDTNETQTSAVDGNSQDDEATDEEALPSDFPESVPVYEPSSVTTVNMSGDNYVAGLRTDNSKDEVVAFYEAELNSNGWSVVMSDDNGRFTASNDGMNVVVDVTEAGDGAVFTITAPQQ